MSHENMDKCLKVFQDYNASSSSMSLRKLDRRFMQKVYKEFIDGHHQIKDKYKDSKYVFNYLVTFLDHCQAGRWTVAKINFDQANYEHETFAKILDATNKNEDNVAKYDYNSVTTKSSTTDLARKNTDRDKVRDERVTIDSPTGDQSSAQALRDKLEIPLNNTTGKTLQTARNATTQSNQGQSVQQTSKHINAYDSVNYKDTQTYKGEHPVGKHQDDITDSSNAKSILQNVTPVSSMEKGLSSPEYHTHRKSEDASITKPKMTHVSRTTSVTPSTSYPYYDYESNETDVYRRSKDASMRLKHDKPNISDLSDPNRPSKLTNRFSELYSNEYTDALEELNGTNSNPVESIKYLLDIVKAAYLFCTKQRKQMNDEQIKLTGSAFFLNKITNPSDLNSIECVSLKKKKNPNMSTNDRVRRYEMELRKTAEEAVPNVRQEFMKPRIKVMQERTQWFAEQCVEIVWLMCIQQLPMHLEWVENKREKFNPDLYKDYTKSGKFIEFCVWPIVRLHENGPILTRGIAQGCD